MRVPMAVVRSLLLLLLFCGFAQAGDGPALPPLWSVAPFALLLAAIAAGPLLSPRLWHQAYPALAGGLAAAVTVYYLAARLEPGPMIRAGFDFLSFMAVLAPLFVVTGGIVIRVERRATPMANLILLLTGAVLANLIGTTGASMLLIRPYLHLNRGRLRPYHIAFFIFLVANIGGALTPIGDPPLFLGFLRGIDFFRFFTLAIGPWLMALALLGAMFWWLDARNPAHAPDPAAPGVSVRGAHGLWLLAVVVGAFFLDPDKLPWLPAVTIDLASGPMRFSFVREAIQFGIAVLAWRLADRDHLQANGFSFAPMREVGFLFAGIFATMVPALALIRAYAADGSLMPLDATSFYFGTGLLSSILDNAPTFLVSLAGLEGKTGLTPTQLGASADPAIAAQLAAIAVASVFWGATTYIGNGPNFMVKSICENARADDGAPLVEVPHFAAYVWRFALPCLLPVLILVWLVFFR
jgi:Na+/H+ antiporter NhaD/arsenite permease-like protein